MPYRFGIEAIEIYFPKTYVEQTEFEKFNKAPEGKYTRGLGQLQLSFAYPFEDVNSFCLTVVSKLLDRNGIKPEQVGRLEVGTETLVDKSKSSKTVLMELFKNNPDIEGATSINACYGATNALLNTLNWIQSPSWDGRYGIVVASDLAVYEKGPARCTGGAGAVAILVGPNAKLVFNRERSSYMDNRYDFYKPNPNSEYPVVDGKISINCYLEALQGCYERLRNKMNGKNILQEADFFCFHSPFYKMVQKAFTKLCRVEYGEMDEKQIMEMFTEKVHPCMHVSQRIGNIYTGSLFSTLVSLMMSGRQLKGKTVGLFSYGSGMCSTMMTAHVHENLMGSEQINEVQTKLQNRVKVSPEEYDVVMHQREVNYGKAMGRIEVEFDKIDAGTFYLSHIDQMFRRKYQRHVSNNIVMEADKISETAMARIESLDKRLPIPGAKFYKMSIEDRITQLSLQTQTTIEASELLRGGLRPKIADSMTENVIGMLSLPLSVIPEFVINDKRFVIPMCIQEPSVVAACSSVGKFIAPYSFKSSATPSIMMGEVHLPKCRPHQIHEILSQKKQLIEVLNGMCTSMVKRGGGVTDLRARELPNSYDSIESSSSETDFVLEMTVNVCDAMGANIVNTLCEKLKNQILMMGIQTGIAILSNYCTERKAVAWFEVPVKVMGRKTMRGVDVASKVLEAYNFARKDPFRATTHNKGIMNGIDSVCLATGQDWRAVEAAAHTHASKTGKYMPLTHYEIVTKKNGEQYFRGSLELPIAVGTRGGVIDKNPLYKMGMNLMGNPSSQQLSQVLACVGLAQNFAALRALAIEGIQNGHMKLHGRSTALKSGVPSHLIEQACEFMNSVKKYDEETCRRFLEIREKPRL